MAVTQVPVTLCYQEALSVDITVQVLFVARWWDGVAAAAAALLRRSFGGSVEEPFPYPFPIPDS